VDRARIDPQRILNRPAKRCQSQLVQAITRTSCLYPLQSGNNYKMQEAELQVGRNNHPLF